MIKSFKLLLLGCCVALFAVSACKLEEIPNPKPSLDPILQNATIGELQTLVTGTESLLRQEIGFYYDVVSIIGREYWYFVSSDPRYTGELLGKGSSVLDNAGFYGTRPYAGRYRTVKNANILIEAVTNTSAALSEADRKGYIGFAKTMQAYELHLALNLQYQNGIRLDVADPDNPGPFVSYDEALAGIKALLDEAVNDLDAAGSEFTFSLSEGFSGFDTPATFKQFNRALAARIAMYQNDKAEVNKALGDSFMDMSGDFYMGPYRPFSTAGGELTNPLFRVPDQSDGIIAHPSFVAAVQADPNDDRNNKIALRPSGTLSFDDLSGDYDVVVYDNLESPIYYIRNEELILLAAEAQIGIDNSAAVAAIDVIRTGHGLDPYAGDMTDEALLDEVLNQRRLSLFAEGHRWIDMRRYDRLDELPIDRPDDDVWVQFPRPVSETGG